MSTTMKEEAQNLGQLRQKSIADFFLAGGCRKVPAFEFNVFKSSSTRQTSLPLLSQQQQLLKHDDIDDPDGISSYPSSDINTNDKNVNHNIPSAIIDTNVIENFTDSESSFHRNLYSRIGTYRVYDVVRHSNNKKYGSSRCPLHLFRSLSLSHPQLRSPELSSWLCAKHLSPSGLKLEEQFAHLGARVGISAIRFENQENNNNGSVLFVVGGSNGCIRVYDHEECVGRIQRSFQSSSNSSRVSDPIYPVATVSTRRDIADIQWSVLKTDEIAVAYKFHPIVTIYDLNHPAEPKIILKTLRECHHGNNVIRYLPKDWCMDRHTQTASASTSSLHDKSIQVAPNPVKPLPRSKPTQKILAGSSNGWIRQWTYPSVNNRTSCEWEIRADPSSSRDFPVVDIQLLVATPGAILIANQVGIITLYDLFDLKTATFQSSASPKCLRRLNIWSSIPETIILPLVTGIAIVGSLQYPQLLHVSTSNNHMYLYDLFSESIDIDKFDYAASLSRKRNVVQADENTVDNGQDAKILSAPYTKPVFPTWLDEEVYLLPIHGTTNVHFHGLNVAQFRSVGKSCTSKNPVNSIGNGYSSSIIGSASGSVYSLSSSSLSSSASLAKNTTEFMKNDSICLSLPGHIIQAEWGSNELILSHSLEHYLASSITSVTCRTRSDRLYIDWSTVANNETSSVNPDPVPYIDSNGAGHVDGIETRIEQIFGHTVLLKEPYCGPTVKAGFPRIYLSTNLVPCSTGVKDYSSTSHGSVDRLLHKLTFHNAVTSVEAHPSLPYIVLGFLDNTIQILCTETYIDEKAGNNDNDINVS